ncbi:MAG: box helicase domain protein [Enterovirga sp.]|nr:box helicase domain protein [Enterovirga sp.]
MLAGLAGEAGASGLVHVAGSEGRLERLARLLWGLAPQIDTYLFPPWDCLPYDRISPSFRTMGLRIATLAALAGGRTRPFIVLTTPEGLLQKVPPRPLWQEATLGLKVGDALDVATLGPALSRLGYVEDERVDEAGEFAIRGQVVDVFPAGYYLPVRLDLENGRISAIASFDAASQRRTDPFEVLELRPASEAVPPEGQESARHPGLEHRLPELYPELDALLDHAPDAMLVFEPKAEARRHAFLEQLRDSYESRLRLGGGDARPVAPERLFLDEAAYGRRIAGHATVALVEDGEAAAAPSVPNFALSDRPWKAAASFIAEQRAGGRRVVVAGADAGALARLSARIEKATGTAPVPLESWDEVVAASPSSLVSLVLGLEHGFVAPEHGVAAITEADLLGSRARAGRVRDSGLAAFGEEEFRLGDAVVHLAHGVGRLDGLETVETEPGRPMDTIRLTYAGDTTLMAPVSDIDLIWRYGAADTVSLDKLDGESWPKRRAKVEAEIGVAARELARLAAERRAADAPKLVPPRRDYERFVARFPFSETPDQHAAVSDILRDLASGHRMDRLVCGDVGFGKTEVALRAAAAAAMAGKQVAVVAPTTVLVRQHLQTFARRLAGFGLEVGHLSRLVKPAEAKQVKAGLKDGSIRVVVGTHALAAKDVAFADLGLLIVDEEQRFGAADKEKLRALGTSAHVLTLTATPIPRTMQSALVGLHEVSTLTTPPAERQPVRTFVMPFDDATACESLKREKRRGGQSFVVCPQIEDIAPMAERLRALVPYLAVKVAHGKLPADEIDRVMVDFADGEGDVLLATNIIESGLDVPRANTILIWRADRFGLAQLHQLRGRVGRGRARGVAYLLTDPAAEVPEATRKRLGTLERLDRLGAGFAISAEDLDQRGAGDLLGDTQAGHVKLIGAGLYRRLLERALAAARGDAVAEEWIPDLNIGLSGRIPADYVPEPEVRLNLYARVARSADPRADARLADEIEDRFGPPPEPVTRLLAASRLRRLCRAAGIAKVDAGPQAIALTFKERREDDPAVAAIVAERGEALSWRGERLVLAQPEAEGEDRLETIEALVRDVGRPS